MDLNDLNKVWEIKLLKRIGEDDQRGRFLKRWLIKQVQPIMRKRKWKVSIFFLSSDLYYIHVLCNGISVHLVQEECEEQMVKGISSTGKGFDLYGRRLGGFSQQQPPLSCMTSPDCIGCC
ncbi:hypothetical protein JHK87_040918 [Glycine soja]|nr:hypothetical protein JHK87_040918 [Glycine soja]